MMSEVAKHAFSIGTMISGTAIVFGSVIFMNSDEKPPPEEASNKEVDFKVEKTPPPKRERPKPKPKPTAKKSSNQAPTPMPNLGSAISAPALALPGFDISDLGGNLSDKLLGDTDKKITSMAGAACDEPPKATRRAKPEFPDAARSRGVSGHVKMSVRIGTDGRVDTIKVLEASPPGVFDNVAKQAMQEWEFSPCVYESEAVVGWVTQTIVFELGRG